MSTQSMIAEIAKLSTVEFEEPEPPKQLTPLQKLMDLAKSFGPGCERISAVVLDDPRFVKWSGSAHPSVHHYGEGQLAQHTLEVVDIAIMNNQYFHQLGKSVDSEHLFLACLFHDVGKLWDYEPLPPLIAGPEPGSLTRGAYQDWISSAHKRKIYHISRSGIVWSKAFDQHGSYLPSGAHDEVLHGILAHHGRREWGSPVEPLTRLGYLVHLADMTSARINDCENPRNVIHPVNKA